jgi:hypothetical protein
MDGGEQLGRCLSFLDSAAVEEYGIHMKGLSKIVKNKTNNICTIIFEYGSFEYGKHFL